MTEYEPGRVYSGIYAEHRELFIWTGSAFSGLRKVIASRHVTDVRGPLVVLDLNDAPVMPGDLISTLREGQLDAEDWLAEQIEEQTRPPLQVGWHEVISNYGAASVLLWDGSAWWFSGNKPVGTAHTDKWTSTHYIGPGSDQS